MNTRNRHYDVHGDAVQELVGKTISRVTELPHAHDCSVEIKFTDGTNIFVGGGYFRKEYHWDKGEWKEVACNA